MAVEPYTAAAFVVSTASMITAGAATFAARYVREARDNSDKALRLLQGEHGVDDKGLVHHVQEHREALLAINAYPPASASQRQPAFTRGGEHVEQADDDLATDGGQTDD